MSGKKQKCPQCGRWLRADGTCTSRHVFSAVPTAANGTKFTPQRPNLAPQQEPAVSYQTASNVFHSIVPPRAATPAGQQKPELCYGADNVYHGTIRVSLARVRKTLANLAQSESPDKGKVAATIYRTAVLVNEYNPDVHGGTPNVLSSRTRAEASWVVNQYGVNGVSSYFVSDPNNERAIYLNAHVRELLKSTDSDLRTNPHLNEALRKHQAR